MAKHGKNYRGAVDSYDHAELHGTTQARSIWC